MGQYIHTVSIHDFCDNLPNELALAILELNCDRDVTVEVINYHVGTTSSTGPDPDEIEYEADAEALANDLITDLVRGCRELPVSIICDHGADIKYTLRDSIQANIQKFINEKLPDLMKREKEDADCDSILNCIPGGC